MLYVLTIKALPSTNKENTIQFNLHSTKAAEEGDDGDNCSNDDDDIDGRGVEADVKLAVKVG